MIIVVGEKHGGDGAQTNTKLADMAGVSVETFMDAVLWINLWEYDGTDPLKYVRMIESVARPGDAVLMLGRAVARAFSLKELPALHDVVRGAGAGPSLILIPHPSGLNRWYNDPEHAAAAADVMKSVWLQYSRVDR